MAESVKNGDTKMTSSEQATSGDWSHVVQDALSVIINEEKHPDPGNFSWNQFHEKIILTKFTSTFHFHFIMIFWFFTVYAKTYLH